MDVRYIRVSCDDLARYIRRSECLDEVLRLLKEKHGIDLVFILYDWGVCDRKKGLLQRFPTFSQAFEFALGLLEVKG